MVLKDKEYEIPIQTNVEWMDPKDAFYEPYIRTTMPIKLGKDIIFEWLIKNQYKLDTTDANKTFCQMVVKDISTGAEERIDVPFKTVEGSTITIEWNPAWDVLKIVRIEAHASAILK